MREGLNIAAFESRFGVKFEQVFGKAMRETQSLGLTELSEGHLRLRDEAVLLGDEAFSGSFLQTARKRKRDRAGRN